MNSPHQYQACIDACNTCAAACNTCFAECLKESDIQMMVRCMSLDVDCAALCTLAAGAMARNSEMARHFCRLCGEVCLACANECDRHAHSHCKSCAQACRDCAQACAAMTS